jgi:predicted amidophosphoribosyltransferase
MRTKSSIPSAPLGDVFYRLKNREDRSTIEPIVETVVEFLKMWHLKVKAIAPVPPSKHRETERDSALRFLRAKAERHGAIEGRL